MCCVGAQITWVESQIGCQRRRDARDVITIKRNHCRRHGHHNKELKQIVGSGVHGVVMHSIFFIVIYVTPFPFAIIASIVAIHFFADKLCAFSKVLNCAAK